MSDPTRHQAGTDAVFDERGHWQPPDTFRELVADTEHAANQLLTALTDQQALLVPVERIEFLARRVQRLARYTHDALPWEVE